MIVKIVINIIGGFLRIDEDQSSRRGHGYNQVVETCRLLITNAVHQLNVKLAYFAMRYLSTYALMNVKVGRAGTANANANVVSVEMILGNSTHFLVECCGEHQVTMIRIFIVVCK